MTDLDYYISDKQWANANARCRRWEATMLAWGEYDTWGTLRNLRWLYLHGSRRPSLLEKMAEICDRLNSESRRKA